MQCFFVSGLNSLPLASTLHYFNLCVAYHLFYGHDFICCLLPSSLPLCVRTRLWAWLTWCECCWSVRYNSARLNQTINCIFLMVHTVAIAWWWSGGESWRQTLVSCAFSGYFMCVCVGLLGIVCLWAYVFVREWMCLRDKEINLSWLDIHLMIVFQ